VASAAKDRERYSNAKAERFWNLRSRFLAGEVSGLIDEMLAELAAITWLIGTRGEIAIEGKSDVKAALGHSPDLAEALMLALGEGAPVPFSYTVAPPDPRAGLGYGHRASVEDRRRWHCQEHPWREACGPCSIQREDRPATGRLAVSLRSKGAW
jgi:hypothetical protein